MVELVYAKWENYEHGGWGDEAIEYGEAVKSNKKDKDFILRHVIIGPSQKAWAARDLSYSPDVDDYDYINPPFILSWEATNDFQYITRDEFEKAWQEANGPYYSDQMIQDLAKIRYD